MNDSKYAKFEKAFSVPFEILGSLIVFGSALSLFIGLFIAFWFAVLFAVFSVFSWVF